MRKQFTFRMDDRIYFYLMEKAKTEKRSMNNLMEVLLEEKVNEEIGKETEQKYYFEDGHLVMK